MAPIKGGGESMIRYLSRLVPGGRRVHPSWSAIDEQLASLNRAGVSGVAGLRFGQFDDR